MTLSGLRGYSEDALDLYDKKNVVLRNSDLQKEEKRAALKELNSTAENLTVILFTYALYQKFLVGDQAIKNSVSTFEGLGINAVHIGSMELSRESRYYDLGRILAEKLYKCIEDPVLARLFQERAPFHEIASWFKNSIS